MNKVKEQNIKSLLSHQNPYRFSLALYEYLDEGFRLHIDDSKGYHLDDPSECHMILEEVSLVIKLKANTFFGCTLSIVEDPEKFLGDDWVIGEPEHLYDSTSHLNKNKDGKDEDYYEK